jgi:hypothetical protein
MADLQDVIDKLTNEGELTRNKGAHSIKSVKQLITSNQESPAQRKQSAEDARNAAGKTNTLLESIASGVSVNSSGVSEAKKSGKLGGLLGGIGASLGGLGIGAGVAMGGLGALFAGGGYLLKQLAEFDGKAVVANVKELFKIADLTDGIGDAFSKGGAFLATMTSIGVGLAVFGIGSAIAGLADGLTNFVNPNWAQSIVDNVVILLSISEKLGGSLLLIGKSGAFFLSMSGIGLGLGVFGVGSALVGLSQFVKKDDWAKKVVERVTTLLSISTLLGGNTETLKAGGTFFVVMTGIGAGLAVFGAGSALVGLGQFITKDDWATKVYDSVATLMKIPALIPADSSALAEGGSFVVIMAGIAAGLIAFAIGSSANSMSTALGQFSGAGAKFADDIVYNVKKLMEISALKFGDVAKFAGFMTAIAAGLFAFAVGKGANAMGDVIGKFTGNFADNIVKDVNTLMAMINDPNVNQEKANEFSSIMGTIAAGLVKFSAGKFVGTLAGAAASVLNFLGGTGPIQEIKNLAAEADNIEKGANAIGKVADNLGKIGNLKFDGSNINIKDFSKDLLDSVPAIEAAIMGGKIEGGIFSSDIVYKGLASGEIKWDDAAKNIRTIQAALKLDAPDISVPEVSSTTSVDISEATTGIFESLKSSIDDLSVAIASIPSGGNIVNAPTNVRNEGDVVGGSPVVNTRYGSNMAYGF